MDKFLGNCRLSRPKMLKATRERDISPTNGSNQALGRLLPAGVEARKTEHLPGTGENCQPKLLNPVKLTVKSRSKEKAITEQRLNFTIHRVALTELLMYVWKKKETSKEEVGCISNEEQITDKHMDKSK